MKQTIKTIILLFVIAVMSIGCSKVPAGNVGVKVYLLGGNKGVDMEELGVGRYWIGWNEELFLFPTFQQNYVWTQSKTEGSENDESFSFQTVEGLSVGADIGISYHIDPTMVTSIFQKYRKGVEEITDIFLRNMVRDALNTVVSTLPVQSVYGAGKQALLQAVQETVMDQVGPQGIIIDKIYLIGNFRLPEAVVESINKKILATQRAVQRENEVREAQAEAKKTVAIARGEAESVLVKAKAEAEALHLKNAALTDRLIQYETIKEWNGVLPLATGSGAIPFLNLTQAKK